MDSELEKNRKIREYLTPTIVKKLKDVMGKCERCKRKGGLDVHHIKPVSKGGTNIASNLIVICPNCHRDAHDKNITQKDLKDIVSKRKITLKKEFNTILRDRKKVDGREVNHLVKKPKPKTKPKQTTKNKRKKYVMVSGRLLTKKQLIKLKKNGELLVWRDNEEYLIKVSDIKYEKYNK